MRVEEYIQLHQEELAAITPEERDEQVTTNFRSSLLGAEDLTLPVDKDNLWGYRKPDGREKIREKRQVVHPGKESLTTNNILI